jgi:hypothetical protein
MTAWQNFAWTEERMVVDHVEKTPIGNQQKEGA